MTVRESYSPALEQGTLVRGRQTDSGGGGPHYTRNNRALDAVPHEMSYNGYQIIVTPIIAQASPLAVTVLGRQLSVTLGGELLTVSLYPNIFIVFRSNWGLRKASL